MLTHVNFNTFAMVEPRYDGTIQIQSCAYMLGTRMCFAKTAEPIEMPFAERTRIGPSDQVLDLRPADPYGTDTSAGLRAAPSGVLGPFAPHRRITSDTFYFFSCPISALP